MTFEYPEGATPLEPDELDGLLLTHITTRGELDRWEQDNIVRSLSWLSKAKPKDVFNEKFIKTLHKQMFGDVWKWAGQFRQSNKNIGIDWWQISVGLKNLFEDVALWMENDSESHGRLAARFHHRLVQIHPFPNGNGRHARLMADIILESIYAEDPLEWGRTEELSKTSEIRQDYISALRAADELDYAPLFKFIEL